MMADSMKCFNADRQEMIICLQTTSFVRKNKRNNMPKFFRN